MKLNTKLLTITAVFIAALMLLSPISQINTSGGGGTNNYDLDFLNSLDINNNNFVLSADSSSDSVDINNVSVVDKSGTKELQCNGEEVDSKTTFISISDVAGLKKLSKLVNDDSKPFEFSGYTIKLTKNLILDDPAQEGQSNFTPIGKDEQHKFNGTFDGQGHAIFNLQISGVKYAGLFGVLGSESTVKNLGIINSLISATATNGTVGSGGIAGLSYGTIENCYNIGNVTANSTNSTAYSGGIAGSSYGTITNCYNTGFVTGSGNSGGIAGYNPNGTITNCYNTGVVTGSGNSGGIVGVSGVWNNIKGTITNCYNIGDVNGSGNSGGIAGWNSGGAITNCYNTGVVTGSTSSGGIVGHNDIDREHTGTITSCYYKMDSSPTGSGSGTVMNCKSFDENGNLSGENKSLLEVLNEWVKNPTVGKSGDYRYWMDPFIKNEKYPVFTDWYGEAKRLGITLPNTNDKGVYEIANGYQLARIADRLDGNYVLADDIDLSGYEWRPIGKDELQTFIGIFDGQGHTISNISVNITSDSSDVVAGLFGYLDSNATIKNLGITNSLISATSTNGNAYSGGIAGYNPSGTITNCYNTGFVASTANNKAFSGGIVGYNEGTITNCYNNGVVTGSGTNAYSGGIAGYNSGTVTNCYNAGFVTATRGNAYLGGIAGRNNETITNCYNTGVVTISYEFTYACSGGIAGENNEKIENCYNAGIVTAIATNNNAYSGGIVGVNYETITNCYNTGDVAATANKNAYSGGIVGYNSGVTVTNCYNTGDVAATANKNAYSGGIVGYTSRGTIENTFYLESADDNNFYGIGNTSEDEDIKTKKLTSDDMKELKLLTLGSNNLNKDKDGKEITDSTKPWSPDIFNVNNGYPILADVPTQIDPNSINKPPQSAVYVTLGSEDNQAENYLKPFMLTNGNEVTATINYLNNQTEKITSHQWYTMDDKGVFIEVNETSLPGTIQETYYVKVTIDGYSYTSLTRTVSDSFIVMFDNDGGSGVDSIMVSKSKAIDEPEAPTKDNYVFAGWYTDEKFTSEYTFNTTVTKNITLYAKWEAKATVTVKLDDTTWDTFDEEVYLHQNGKQKYELTGSDGVYSADVDLGEYQIYVKMESTDIDDPVDTNVTIDLSNGNKTAEVQYWTVTFDYNDNKTDHLEKIVLNNSSVTGPESPTRIGYEFKGWYSDEALSTPYNFEDEVTKNTTLYAKWKEIEYGVVYDGNNNTSGTVPTDTNKEYTIGNTIKVELNEGNLAKSGHIFRGWNYTPNASSGLSSPIILDERVIKDYIDKDNILTLYAVWTPIPEPIYTLCLNSNDSTLQTKRYSGTYGTEITLKSASDFGWNDECKFIEWNSKSDGSGVSYKEGDKFSLGSDVWNLYAIWSDSSYHTVSFDSNGGNSIPSQSVQDGYRASEPTDPVKQGHSFKHWSLNGTKYDFNQSVKEDITLKAEYEIISYKVTFYYNGGVYYSTVADYNTSLGDRMPSLPSDKDSWNTSENCKGNNFNADSLITSDTSVYAVSENSITSILIIGGSAAAILAAIAAWLFMRSRYN